MIEIEHRDATLRIADLVGNTLDIETRGWEEAEPHHDIEKRVDTVIGGRLSECRLPPRSQTFMTALDGDVFEGDGMIDMDYQLHEPETIDLPEGAYRLRFEGNLTVFLRFDGAATIEGRDDGTTIAFAYPYPVTIGVRSNAEYPRETITVPPTPAGLATALSHLSSGLRTTTPDRSFPSLRQHPPRVETGAETAVPEAVRERTPDTGIELCLPASRPALFPAAPLAYYLGARVRVEEGADPRVRAPSAGLDRRLDPLPGLQDEVAGLLRRAFLLDCLVRNAGPYGNDIHELDVLADVDFDIERWYDAAPAARLAAYLEVDFGAISGALPPWHHRAYVEPSPAHVPALPFLAADLAQVYLPGAFESPGDRGRRDDAWRCIDGWLVGDGHREGAYTALVPAYENRLARGSGSAETFAITVVVTDGDRAAAGRRLAEAYADGSYIRQSVVERRVTPSTDELASLLSSGTDLLHLVGRSADGGFECPDGRLDPSSIEASRSQVFVLDAARSGEAGADLVGNGSVAGVVARGAAPMEADAALGSFLLQGVTPATATRIAREHGIVAAGAAVVGDGSYRLGWGSGVEAPFVVELDEGEEGFRATARTTSLSPGSLYEWKSQRVRLPGSPTRVTLDAEALRDPILDPVNMVVYDGTVYTGTEKRRLLYPMA